MSAPIETIRYTIDLVASADFWPHVATTGLAFLGALAIALTGGPIIGSILGFHRLSGEVGKQILVSLYSIPKVILYPIILLFFGIGLAAEVAYGALHGIVPVMLFTMNAVRNIKPVLIRTGRVMGLSSWTLMRTILFPAALPEIFTGVRVGFSVTLLGVDHERDVRLQARHWFSADECARREQCPPHHVARSPDGDVRGRDERGSS